MGNSTGQDKRVNGTGWDCAAALLQLIHCRGYGRLIRNTNWDTPNYRYGHEASISTSPICSAMQDIVNTEGLKKYACAIPFSIYGTANLEGLKHHCCHILPLRPFVQRWLQHQNLSQLIEPNNTRCQRPNQQPTRRGRWRQCCKGRRV